MILSILIVLIFSVIYFWFLYDYAKYSNKKLRYDKTVEQKIFDVVVMSTFNDGEANKPIPQKYGLHIVPYKGTYSSPIGMFVDIDIDNYEPYTLIRKYDIPFIGLYIDLFNDLEKEYSVWAMVKNINIYKESLIEIAKKHNLNTKIFDIMCDNKKV